MSAANWGFFGGGGGGLNIIFSGPKCPPSVCSLHVDRKCHKLLKCKFSSLYFVKEFRRFLG